MALYQSVFLNSLFLSLLLLPIEFGSTEGFKADQLQHARVKEAKSASHEMWQRLFEKKGLAFPPENIYYRAFKDEMLLEVWVQNSLGLYILAKEFDICRISGELGPKRREGDRQVPEGFYHIGLFNPWSSFYLSFEVTYPNASDKILGIQGSLGGDIYVHGKCATIGCLPMTDEKIKELYWLSVLAKDNGQDKIPFHIFPFKMGDKNFAIMSELYEDNEALLSFWRNLKEGYDKFNTRRSVPDPHIDSRGKYLF